MIDRQKVTIRIESRKKDRLIDRQIDRQTDMIRIESFRYLPKNVREGVVKRRWRKTNHSRMAIVTLNQGI